jgi:hypothetical protein
VTLKTLRFPRSIRHIPHNSLYGVPVIDTDDVGRGAMAKC